MSCSDSGTGTSQVPSSSNGWGSSSAAPAQPIHAPWLFRITGSSAVTSPPGLRRQVTVPSLASTRSTGSRLATTTNELLPCCLSAMVLLPPGFGRLAGIAEADLIADLVQQRHYRERVRMGDLGALDDAGPQTVCDFLGFVGVPRTVQFDADRFR